MRIQTPYYLVKHDNIEVKHGLSGSPWIVYDKEFKLLGTHIGKVKTNNRVIDRTLSLQQICFNKILNSKL